MKAARIFSFLLVLAIASSLVAAVQIQDFAHANSSEALSGQPASINLHPASLSGGNTNVTFSEKGLSSGTVWVITLGNTTESSSNISIAFNVPIGMYNFTVGIIPGFHADIYSGTVNASGSGTNQVNISWVPFYYTMTFHETGLPANTTWSVHLSNGKTYDSSGQFISIYLSNGTYTYTIEPLQGYSMSPANGSASIHGKAPPYIEVQFSSTSAKTHTTSYYYYVIAGSVIAIGAAVSAFAVRRGRSR